MTAPPRCSSPSRTRSGNSRALDLTPRDLERLPGVFAAAAAAARRFLRPGPPGIENRAIAEFRQARTNRDPGRRACLAPFDARDLAR